MSENSLQEFADNCGPDCDGLEPGQSVGHCDFDNFRAIYVGPGENGKALVKVVAGWTCEPPAWPVPIPYSKLEVLT